MTKSGLSRYWRLRLAGTLAIVGVVSTVGSRAIAQVRPDNTLGAESSQVTSTGPGAVQINGGATRGTNLFHSFSQFSVPSNGVAAFNNALSIQNIISRVTGGSGSNIDGLIRANYPANLFLINPNGIIFGPNARLNIGGSFVGSTANSLKFADGTNFSATAPQTTPLLTVSVPIGLQFGTNPGSIRNQSQLTIQVPDNSGNQNSAQVGLQVQPGKTLALVGGDVTLDQGSLSAAGFFTASGGRIELGSVAGPGLVSLMPINKGWFLGYDGVQTFGNINSSGNKVVVRVSGLGGGDIQVRGSQVTLTDGSQFLADTLGSESGGTLNVTASDSVRVRGSRLSATTFGAGAAGKLTIATGKLIISDGGSVANDTGYQGNGGNLSVNASDAVQVMGKNSILSADTIANGTGGGAAGSLTIATGKLILSDGARVSSNTYNQGGQGGKLSVNASDSVQVMGSDSTLSASSFSPGAAGELTIATGKLILRDGGKVLTSAFKQGPAGNIDLKASDSVQVMGSGSGLFAQGLGAPKAAGSLTIATGKLMVSDGAHIGVDSYTSGLGQAGNLSVKASDSVQVMGSDSGLFAQTTGAGAGGKVTIVTGNLIVRDGGKVRTENYGQGQGGDLSITASDSLQVMGENSILSTRTFDNPGAAGSLTIATEKLIVRDGAQVSASTSGRGKGGNIEVNATNSINLSGVSSGGQSSGLFTDTSGVGQAGTINVNSNTLRLANGAKVAVNSQGTGQGGSLNVKANYLNLDNQAFLSATTKSSEGGNIALNVPSELLMRHNSEISATAGLGSGSGNGGNIMINTPLIVAVPSENSHISANAFTGNGGKVNINIEGGGGIFGIQSRTKPTSESDITATSTGGGINGVVNINTSLVNPSAGLVALPVVLADASQQIAQGCGAGDGTMGSQFTLTGRGGLPPNPGEPLSSDAIWEDARLRATTLNQHHSQSVTAPKPFKQAAVPMVPATGWVFNNKGEVTLTALAPTATPYIPWLKPTTCHAQ